VDDDRIVETDLAYADGEAVTIRVRKRGHFYHLDDDGAAVAKARALGATPDWLELASEVVAVQGFNVNRRGVVFVSVGRGRDVEAVATRLGEHAYSVHTTLLETIEQ
jgi:hypothetical protein